MTIFTSYIVHQNWEGLFSLKHIKTIPTFLCLVARFRRNLRTSMRLTVKRIAFKIKTRKMKDLLTLKLWIALEILLWKHKKINLTITSKTLIELTWLKPLIKLQPLVKVNTKRNIGTIKLSHFRSKYLNNRVSLKMGR